jgi:colicin import membrane protein
MNAHSPSAYSLSMMLHGAFVAAMLFTAFAFKDDSSRKSTEIFELVAGEGSNWAATEAPAAGTPDGIKFQPSAKPVPQPRPEPPQPEPVAEPSPITPSPVAPTPVEAVAPPKTEPPKVTPPQKTLAQQVQQTAARKEKAIVTKFRRDEAARAKKEAAEKAKRDAAEAAAAKKMTKEEFDRLNGKKMASTSKTNASSYEKISTKGITGGVAGGTTDQPGAGGKVLSRAEQDQLGTYFAALRQKIKEAHEKPLGAGNALSARVSFYVAANGAIGQVKIIKSSGDPEFDQSVLAAFRAITSIGPRPDGRGDTNEATFNMKDTD